MKEVISGMLIAYGSFNLSEHVAQHLTGYFAGPLPLDLGLIITPASFLLFLASGCLILVGRNWGKHLILAGLALWLYQQFSALAWPINMPEFRTERLGLAGVGAWKPVIDISVLGLMHGGAIFSLWLLLVRNDLTSYLSRERRYAAPLD